jgi:hypothetical protein
MDQLTADEEDRIGTYWERVEQRAEQARAEHARQKRRTAAALIGLAVVIASLGMLSRWLGRVRYPEKWDPKVASLAAETERLRGLKFKRPVYIRSVPAAKFDEADKAQKSGWKSDSGSSSDEVVFRCNRSAFGSPPCEGAGGKEVDPVGSVLRALRVVDEKSPAFGMPMSFDGSLVIARYDDKRKRVEIRGPLDGIPNAVLVHELTHVLQDQHFGFHCKCPSLDHSLGYRSLIEGDASRIENRFMANHRLAPKEVKAIEALDADSTKRVEAARNEESLDTTTFDLRLGLAFFPYDEGQDFVLDLEKNGGQPAIDAAFRKPPRSSAEVFRRKVLAKPISLSMPTHSGAYNSRSFPIGAWYWREAFRANGLVHKIDAVTSAWAAEATVVFAERYDSNVCFQSRIALLGPQADVAAAALKELSTKLKSGTFDKSYEVVEGALSADSVTVGACDPAGIGGVVSGGGTDWFPNDSIAVPETSIAVPETSTVSP